jgi:hypothetical protein
MRVQAVSQADEAGAAEEAIQGAMTHTQTTTLRYIRRRTKEIADVAKARKPSRVTNSDAERR